MENRIRTLAVDDEPLALKQLATYIKNISFLELVGECQNAIEAKREIERQTVDAIFIDINMPDMSGLDFVRSLEVKPLVVFTTAYSDYAIEGYKVEAIDYLLKPFSQEELMAAAKSLRRQYALLQQAKINVSLADNDTLFLKNEYKIIRINISDIRYVEGMGEYLKIHFISDRKPLMILSSMKKMEKHLANNSFMRIHRSWIINLIDKRSKQESYSYERWYVCSYWRYVPRRLRKVRWFKILGQIDTQKYFFLLSLAVFVKKAYICKQITKKYQISKLATMLTLKKYTLSRFCRARQNSGVNASCVRSACRSLSLGGGATIRTF